MSPKLIGQPAPAVNGTSVLTRPLVPLIGVRGLRTLSVALLVVACVVLASFVGRTSGRWAAAGFIAPLATADLVGLVEVFHHPLMLAIGLFGVVVLGRAATGDLGDQRIAEIAIVVGSVYSFFDLMNFVTGILALSITVVGLCSPNLDLRARIRRMVTTGGAWGLGYVLTWSAKWAFAAIASSPQQVWDAVADQFLFRLGGDHEALSGRIGAGFERTLETWLDPRLTKLLVLAALVALVWAAVRLRPEDRLTAIVIAAPALLPVVFMLVANNHHEAHHWFEFRNLALSLSIVLMVAGHFAGGTAPISKGADRSEPHDDIKALASASSAIGCCSVPRPSPDEACARAPRARTRQRRRVSRSCPASTRRQSRLAVAEVFIGIIAAWPTHRRREVGTGWASGGSERAT